MIDSTPALVVGIFHLTSSTGNVHLFTIAPADRSCSAFRAIRENKRG